MMRERLASLTSNILNPFLVSLITIILLTVECTFETGEALKWILISLAFSVIPLLLVVLYLVRRKKLEGVFVNQREQRNGLYMLAAILSIVGCIVLYFLEVPDLIFVTFFSGLVAVVIFGIINLSWKISLHTAFVAASATIFTVVNGVLGLIAIVPLVLVAWARLELRMHTPGQVIAAAILSSVIVLGVFWGFGYIGK